MLWNFAHAPRLVAWEVTRACDLACRHCRAVAQPHAAPRQLATAEALRLVDDIAAFRQPVILILTGGIPSSGRISSPSPSGPRGRASGW